MVHRLIYRMRKIGAVLAIAAITGCAYRPVSNISADPKSVAEARAVSSAMTEFLVHRLPPASSTLFLTAAGKTKALLPIESQVTADLRSAGFAIAQDAERGAIHIEYTVRPLNGGVVLIIRTPTQEGAQWFARTAEGLQAGSYIAVRQGAEQ